MKEMWYALVEVKPTKGNTTFTESDRGALVNTVGSAEDRQAFVARLKVVLKENHMMLVGIEELQALDERPGWDESDQLRYIASFVSETQPVVLGDVYLFEED